MSTYLLVHGGSAYRFNRRLIPGVYDFSFSMNLDGPSEGSCDPADGNQPCTDAEGNGRLLTLSSRLRRDDLLSDR